MSAQVKGAMANREGTNMRQARQCAKIRELGEALVASGISTLDQQAEALGLSRSTTWTILKGDHKASGLSAAIINRMLTAPQLPPRVRAVVLEYVEEKIAGLYGHNRTQLRKFADRLSSLLRTSAETSAKPGLRTALARAPEHRSPISGWIATVEET